MKNRIRKDFGTASLLLVLFVIFTILLRFIDLDSLAPDGSPVGFAFLNGTVASRFPFHPFFYRMSECLGRLALLLAGVFAFIGLFQWIGRKKLLEVDFDILALGVLFGVTVFTYFLFETVKINVRPILWNGKAENSYPSSHTVLSIVVFVGVLPLLKRRLTPMLYLFAESILLCFTVLTLVGRLLSGMHWITDLFGGILLSVSLLGYYFCFLKTFYLRRI